MNQYAIFTPVGGIKQNLPGILLNDAFAEESVNVIFKDGMVQRMQGRGAMFPDKLNEDVLMLTQYRKRNGSKYLMTATRNKVYYRGQNNWVDITGTTPYTGDASDLWSFCHFNDTFVFTNGVDAPKKWDGMGDVVALGGNPPIAKYVTEYSHYLVFLCLADYPSNIRWGQIGCLEDFSNGDAGECVLDGDDYIRGVAKLGDYLIIFKERSIFRAYPIGGDLVFKIEKINDKIGCLGGHSIVVANGIVYFYGGDNRFYAYAGANEASEISQNIPELCDRINQKANQIYGAYQEGLNRIVWIVPTGESDTPNEMFIYDLDTQAWSKADFPATCLNPTGYVAEGNKIWEEQSDTWDTAIGRWNDVKFLTGQRANLSGSQDGSIDALWQTRQDKNKNFSGIFITKPISFGDLPTYNRLLKVQLYFKNEHAPNAVNVSIKRDYGDTYEMIGTCLLNGAGNELSFILPCNITARNFTMKLESQYRYRFIGAIFHYIPQGIR